jgi:hypothetical protein
MNNRKAGMVNNGNREGSEQPAVTLPADMGTVREPIDPPEDCGDISVPQAAEIKARTELGTDIDTKIEEAQERLKDVQKELNYYGRLRIVAQREREQFVSDIVKSKGLDLADEYRVDPDGGKVWRVARRAPVRSMDLAPVEP